MFQPLGANCCGGNGPWFQGGWAKRTKRGESRRNVKRGAKKGGGLALPPANVGIAHLSSSSQPSLLSGLRTPMCGARSTLDAPVHCSR